MSTETSNLDKHVDYLESSVRLANVLGNAELALPGWAKEAGLPPPRTLGDVVRWSEDDFRRLPHMGKRTLDELRKLLEQEGLALRDPSIGPDDVEGRPTPAAPGAVENAPPSDMQVDDLNAVGQVVRILRQLPADDRLRVLRATCTLLGHDAVFLGDPSAIERLEAHLQTIKEDH